MKRIPLLILLLVSMTATGHPLPHIETQYQAFSFVDIAMAYLQMGFAHVLPLGFDHILFITGLFFLNSNLKSVIVQCTVFTMAHSITLAMAATGFQMPSPAFVEPLIALSIMAVALENLFHQKTTPARLLLIFGFGLIHGMGFAKALQDIGLPAGQFWNPLLMFNLGVELGQITVLLVAYLAIARWARDKPWYRNRVVIPISVGISCLAFYWTIERMMAM